MRYAYNISDMSFWQRFCNYLHYKRNKILAVGFASLGMLCLLGYYLTCEITSGWAYFRNNPLDIWNFAIALFAYGVILVCNLRNDSMAYQGITLFVFYTAFSAALNFIQGAITSVIYSAMGQTTGIIIDVFYGLLWAATAVIGIMLYIYIYKYMAGRYVSWMKIRVFSILYACLLGVWAALMIWIDCLYIGYVDFAVLVILTALPLSEFFIGVSIVFTLERLRRV